MLTILSITAPIFLLIALGFFAVRKELLARTDLQGLGKLVVNFALPALLFKALSQRSLTETIDVEIVLAYTLGSLAVVAAALAIVCLVQKRSLRSGAVVAMGMSLSNSAFIGFPIAQQLIGKEAGAMLALYAVVEAIIMMPILFVLAEIGERDQRHWTTVIGSIFKRLLKNPLILSIIAGVAFSVSGWVQPVFLSRAIDMLSSVSAPVALFFIGGTLAGMGLKTMTSDIGLIAAGKLIVHPLAVFAAFLLIGYDNQTLKTTAIINAGMPMLSIYPILAQKYGDQDISAATLVVATGMSFFTISALLWMTGAG